MKLFSGSSNKPLAEKIAEVLKIEISPIETMIFPDGERRVKLNVSVVDEETVIIQSTNTPVDQNYIELYFIIDALKRSGAKSVTVVIPYLGYQRQDHVFRDGEVVSLEVMIRFFESLQVDNIIALDLHSIKIPEMFHISIKHLSALPLFAERMKSKAFNALVSDNPEEFLKDSILVSPDMGGLRRIEQISEMLGGIPWIATVKDRDLKTGEIAIKQFEGPVKPSDLSEKRALIVDDMISSGNTMVQSAQLLKDNGVLSCDVFATHAIFSEEAPEFLQESNIDRVYVTDTVFIPEEKYFPKLHVLPVAEMIAKALR
ncbi:MAG TPA: ribose-phosphate pyrophosphokinase [Candidatus Sulfotelmatobacter sp.]|jgi:ribose-phosphate pyrophosphokinase|nr:ribose-phosphate pyrophosphokinase [Candidatus Sulfotelmatobacter sp.]